MAIPRQTAERFEDVFSRFRRSFHKDAVFAKYTLHISDPVIYSYNNLSATGASTSFLMPRAEAGVEAGTGVGAGVGSGPAFLFGFSRSS